MWEFIWLFFICAPLFLLPSNFSKNSIKTKIIYAAVFYILFYSTIGLLFGLVKIPVSITNTSILIVFIDLALIIIYTKKDIHTTSVNFKQHLKTISKHDMALSLILVVSFIVYYFSQLQYYSLLAPDSYYWFSGLNYIKFTGQMFIENDVLHWYPDGFHYLTGITFLPFSASMSFTLVKFFGPLFGILTILTLWEYFGDNTKFMRISSILYSLLMPYLIVRFSMFIPEALGLFLIAFAALILKKKDLNPIILGALFGLFTNVYHSTGMLLFVLVGVILWISKINNKKYYIGAYFITSIFYLLPYILDIGGFFVYGEHLTEFGFSPNFWLYGIYASGIVFFADFGVKDLIIGFPIGILFPIVLLKYKAKDKAILFSSILLTFSVILGLSFYLFESGLAYRYKPLFSIGSALLFPYFIVFVEENIQNIFNRKNLKKIIYCFVILILINRALIVSFSPPDIRRAEVSEEESRMMLWIDDNLANSAVIVLDNNIYSSQLILYPRELVNIININEINTKEYYFLTRNSLLDGDELIHSEGNLTLAIRQVI